MTAIFHLTNQSTNHSIPPQEKLSKPALTLLNQALIVKQYNVFNIMKDYQQ